jgi:hypothetical protein
MPNLSSVVFAQSTSIQDATLRCLAQTCTDIRDLDLSMCSMGDEALLEVLFVLHLHSATRCIINRTRPTAHTAHTAPHTPTPHTHRC